MPSITISGMAKVAGLTLAAGLAISAGTALAADATMRMTTTWTSGINLMEGDKKFVEIANAITGDALKIEFFEGGQP